MTERTLKVAYVIDTYRPGAGTENQIRGLIRNLDRSRVEPTLITLRDTDPSAFQADLNCPVDCLNVSSLKSLTGAIKFTGLVRRFRRERFDIVMVYFMDSNLLATPACRLAGIKNSVVNRRDMGYWYEPSLLSKLNYVNRWTSYFLVNSQAVKTTVARCEGFPPDRIEVIPNALWKASTGSVTPISRNDIGIPADAPVVGIVANLRPVKRVDRFLDMAGRIAQTNPETHFVIAGQGELADDLKQQANDLGIAEQTHFLGQVPDIDRCLPLIDVGVLTSESEGLSNTLIEFADAGITAVAFDVGGNSEVIQPETNGLLVPEGDVAKLSTAVGRLVNDRHLRARFAEGGRRLVAKKFDPAHVISRYIEFYRKLAGRENRTKTNN